MQLMKAFWKFHGAPMLSAKKLYSPRKSLESLFIKLIAWLDWHVEFAIDLRKLKFQGWLLEMTNESILFLDNLSLPSVGLALMPAGLTLKILQNIV